jgi:hypothetical protein
MGNRQVVIRCGVKHSSSHVFCIAEVGIVIDNFPAYSKTDEGKAPHTLDQYVRRMTQGSQRFKMVDPTDSSDPNAKIGRLSGQPSACYVVTPPVQLDGVFFGSAATRQAPSSPFC